ncbi:tyrosine-type recombinase/integrase [Burkholderia pseudomallei]|uniref:tyrosine-type recombinase/integrase n=1 Tax=Burkholderia pseudomallei TaxID=28450 RepID=UPI0009AFF1EA|nr:tyrosine-type recombinase/integrase [Burkholderia pseudomallei]
MYLETSTDDFIIAGVARPGFPILLWEDMSSCEEVNQFLRFYLLRGAIESTGSWIVIAGALYDYFGFLEAHGLDWRDVERGEQKNLVAAYRDYCYTVCGFKRSTVRLRLVYVSEFYKYAIHKTWIGALPYAYEMRRLVRSGGFLAHLNPSGAQIAVPSVMPKRHKNLVKFLSREEALRLLRAADNVHHHAIISTALRTGLRREELATFPLSYVFDPDSYSSQSLNTKVTLDPEDGSGMLTKGSKPRDIWVSTKLMRFLHRYTVHYRGERANLTNNSHPELFLNQDGLPYSDGGKGITGIVSAVGSRAGLRAYPHLLRHTYATHTLARLQQSKKANGINPLVFIQLQLGHDSLETTKKYLHISNEEVDNAVLEYDHELDAESTW